MRKFLYLITLLIPLFNFSQTFSGRILPSTDLVTKMMRENGKYILFIRDIRSGYTKIDEKKNILVTKK